MPPKAKITKENILEASLKLVRHGGISALNARAIANELNCSTQPIFTVYMTMDEAKTDVINMAREYFYKFFTEHIKRQDVPPYKASGLAYIKFAKDEKELFKLLFMRDRTEEQKQINGYDFDVAIKMIMADTGFNYDTAKKLHLNIYIVAHGMATMIATSYLDMSNEVINEILTDTYQSLLKQYQEKQKGSTGG